MQAVKRTFDAKFLNRLEDVAFFERLTPGSLHSATGTTILWALGK